MRRFTALVLGGLLSACATASFTGLPPVTVTAVAETEPVGTANEDAADDPAIWRNADDPAASLIVATDKKASLLIYDLSGRQLFAENSGRINNVDLVDMGTDGVIVVASDRNDPVNARLGLWRLDTANASLTPLGSVPGGTGEGYGLCLLKNGDDLHAFSVLKNGTVEEYRLVLGGEPQAVPVRTMTLPSQAEGCVADPRDGTFYVGEEEGGIWRFAPGESEGQLVAPVDNLQLVADVEGLALLPEGSDGGWLVASSQGDNAFAVFRLPGMEPVGRFRIGGGRFGSVEETDGIELIGGSFGPAYPEGLFVAQDGVNADRAQNFKLVSWKAIKEALGLR